MPVKTKQYANTADIERDPVYYDSTIEQRTAISPDGYAFHYGPNETRNFADDGIGAAVAAFSAVDGAQEETRSAGTSRS